MAKLVSLRVKEPRRSRNGKAHRENLAFWYDFITVHFIAVQSRYKEQRLQPIFPLCLLAQSFDTKFTKEAAAGFQEYWRHRSEVHESWSLQCLLPKVSRSMQKFEEENS